MEKIYRVYMQFSTFKLFVGDYMLKRGGAARARELANADIKEFYRDLPFNELLHSPYDVQVARLYGEPSIDAKCAALVFDKAKYAIRLP